MIIMTVMIAIIILMISIGHILLEYGQEWEESSIDNKCAHCMTSTHLMYNKNWCTTKFVPFVANDS